MTHAVETHDLTRRFGRLEAVKGTATVLGADTRRLGPREFQRIGYVSENQRLPDWMTADELFDYCRPW